MSLACYSLTKRPHTRAFMAVQAVNVNSSISSGGLAEWLADRHARITDVWWTKHINARRNNATYIRLFLQSPSGLSEKKHFTLSMFLFFPTNNVTQSTCMYLRRTVHIVIYKSNELCHHIVISTTSNDVLWLIPFYDGNEGGGNHIFNINGNKMGSFVLPSLIS